MQKKQDDTAQIEPIAGERKEDAGMAYVPPPQEQNANMLIKMGEMQATLGMLAQTITRMESSMQGMMPRAEHDRQQGELIADIKDLQRWRDTVLQATGKDRLDIEQSISGVGKRQDERSITQNQAIIGILLTALLLALLYIAQNHH